MRIAPAVLAMWLIAGAAAGQDAGTTTQKQTPPDFSRDKLTHIFSDVIEPPPPARRNVEFGLGYIDFKALNMRWRFIYLPIMAPLPGSIRGANAAPLDAFSMLNVPYAQTPRTWSADQRAVSSELKRIERMERERAKIKVEPDKQ